MMMFHWEKDMIRFMKDASEYCDYNERMASMIAQHLGKDSYICDAGCGLGYLSLALSPYAGEIAAVDINENALKVLRENCSIRKIENISIYNEDIRAVKTDRKFDAMVFCFYGSMDGIFSIAKEKCKGKVFVIQRAYENHRFSVGHIMRNNKTDEKGYIRLDDMRIPYERKSLSLEMGQPFKNLQDARLFFETYSRDSDKSLITDEFIRNKLVATGKEDFPFYMPHKREICWLVFNSCDIPDSIQKYR